eukprot:SAG11_NODE_330_length_10677_cov_8.535117_11_plen_134_part_00
MEPQPENPQGPTLSDMPTEVVHRIGDFLKPKENGRLGIALGKSKVATQILMGGKRYHAASKIQSFMRAPMLYSDDRKKMKTLSYHMSYLLRDPIKGEYHPNSLRNRFIKRMIKDDIDQMRLQTRGGARIERGR